MNSGGEGSQVEISPVIREGKVVRLEICGLPWPLKSEIPMDDFLKLVEALHLLARYVDLARIGEGAGRPGQPSGWTRGELRAFLEERNEAQKAFLKVLAERGEVTRRELLRELRDQLGKPGYGGKDLAGLVAGINRRIGVLGKEPLFSIERRRIGGRLDGVYKVNPRYRDLLLELLVSSGAGKA